MKSSIQVEINIYLYVGIHIYISIGIYTHEHIFVYAYVCIHAYVFVYTHTYEYEDECAPLLFFITFEWLSSPSHSCCLGLGFLSIMPLDFEITSPVSLPAASPLSISKQLQVSSSPSGPPPLAPQIVVIQPHSLSRLYEVECHSISATRLWFHGLLIGFRFSDG